MPKIVITEIDQTSPGTNSESFEVVYIPGCVDVSQSSLKNSNGEYIGLEMNKPTLFTSVSDFEALCGAKGLTFEEDFDYRAFVSDECSGFPAEAVPYDNIMFRKGTVDPAYVMAKELLAAGLNVLYERINKAESFEKLTSEPKSNETSVWNSTYQNYYMKIKKVVKVDDAAAPKLIMLSDKVEEIVKVSDKSTVKDGTVYVKFVPDTTGKTGSWTALADADYNTDQTTKEKSIKDTIDAYEVTGREFYSTVGTGTGELANVLYETQGTEVKPCIYAKLPVTVLASIPKDWNTTYWKSYFTTKEVTTKVVGSYSGSSNLSAPTFSSLEVYSLKTGVDVLEVYKAFIDVFNQEGKLSDLGNYNLKYLTSGGYPVYEFDDNSIVSKMIGLAEERGDCVAIIDHTDNLHRESNVKLPGSLYYSVSNDVSLQTGGEYGTMFTPWATYNRTTSDKDGIEILESDAIRMPASFAYLVALADSNKTNAPWLAIAGSVRGVVGNLSKDGMTTEIPNGAADAMQPRQGIAVNAITNIKPYGYTIWGNRTLKRNAENITATSCLNIRNLVSDVKKTCYRAARALTFEQNNEILWVNFKSKIAPTLDRMLSGYGISGYKIVRDTQHEKAQEKATVCAKIILFPTFAVEDFYITIVLKDDEVTVESAE